MLCFTHGLDTVQEKIGGNQNNIMNNMNALLQFLASRLAQNDVPVLMFPATETVPTHETLAQMLYWLGHPGPFAVHCAAVNFVGGT